MEHVFERRTDLQADPPLFVTAYSADGEASEGLLGPDDRPNPEWILNSVLVNVEAPSGFVVEIDTQSEEISYEYFLKKLGRENIWSAEHRQPLDYPGLQVLVPEDADADLSDEGTILVIHQSLNLTQKWPPCYAVVGSNGSSLYVGNSGRVYLDVVQRGAEQRVVPRAILDTGLAGAFWGYNDQSNATASRLIAERLLRLSFDDEYSQHLLPTTIVAAAHAILIHDDLFERYYKAVLLGLRSLEAYDVDKILLKAFIAMARVSVRVGPEHGHASSTEEDLVINSVSEAMRLLAERSERPAFGETLRLLDARFSSMSTIAQHYALSRRDVTKWTSHVESMIRCSLAGGQSATYKGLPPEGHWRDIMETWRLQHPRG